MPSGRRRRPSSCQMGGAVTRRIGPGGLRAHGVGPESGSPRGSERSPGIARPKSFAFPRLARSPPSRRALRWPKLSSKRTREAMPGGYNNYVLIVFDSCRYDSFVARAPETIRKLGEVRTALVLRLVDLAFALQPPDRIVPHTSPKHVYRIRILQEGFPASSTSARVRRDRVQVAGPEDVSSRLPAERSATGRTPWCRCRC